MTVLIIAASFLLQLALCAQPSAPSPVAAPLRELSWGQLNFLHTTDIHGWWGGHLQEPSYSADWGDYISFAEHLHDKADAEGSDLLLIDTGDRIEGNAIYDSSKPRGKFTYEIAKEQHIDLICSGNHELYKQNSSEGEYYHTVPDFKGHYIASNLDIYSPETGELQPLAPRFKKFKTKNQGIRILAFGFIFDFTRNAKNTVIHRVRDTVEEPWFKEAIRDRDVDLIIVFGHVDIRSDEYATLYATLRKAYWDTPIQLFGGHSHIRDYKIFDDKSVALESGRYMETLGFMSISGLSTGGTKRVPATPQKSTLTFSRMYIDNNLFSMHHHSGKDESSFPTVHGLNVSAQINRARHALSLNRLYGCAPHDFWVNRRPYPHEESIFSWLEKEMLPDTISTSERFVKLGKKALVITNTGSIRFDIFKGAFTKDTTFLVSPFTSGLRYIKDVPYVAASRVLRLLNSEGPILEALREGKVFLDPPEMAAARLRPGFFSSSRGSIGFQGVDAKGQSRLSSAGDNESIFPGYTTYDDAGTDGDDTVHSPIQFYEVPNCIQAPVGFSTHEHAEAGEKLELPETVDLIYNEFIEKWILMALEYLGERYDVEDTEYYFPGKSFTELMTEWVRDHWGVNGKTCSS
ncbi:ser/Thr protein phosphatase-like protein family [Westerdykella ornata]|uniref:Ser/Thr protein phosphatase-like protein family n=1 Tax=Westerdykella ornata TaxID=318751 RepID=A0A6A6JYM1_WESOR|nr:ser/Thr protein phosphatase-like protein family [Westerdykella ornata]KAF2281507.1 ser/Thr protein phosphatase-like protein family [Westerdykella ornata]